MKKLYTLCYLAILLCVLSTAVLLMFTPDKIPVHYNFAGEVDRFGSKYENLIWPIISIAMGGFLLVFAKNLGKKGKEKDEKILLYTAFFTLVFFEVLGLFFMVKAIQYDPSNATGFGMDIMKFLGLSLGGLQIVLGILMPKASRNSVFGLRTKWSLSSDEIWQKSQRFCGFASVVCGLVMIVMAVILPSMWNLLALAVIVTVWALASICASYYYYKNN